MSIKDRPYCIILDIDGTLVYQPGSETLDKGYIIDHTLPKLAEWESLGYKIILITGRRESARPATEKMLADLGITYDHLIMGAGSGIRVLVNDLDPKHPDVAKAIAVNLPRNEGIGHIKL